MTTTDPTDPTDHKDSLPPADPPGPAAPADSADSADPAAPSEPADPGRPDPAYLAFWRERHLCTLTTLRPDGTPHVVPVGVTYDPEARLARVITRKSSRKVRHVLAAGAEGAPVAVCQVDGGRWATLEGCAFVRTDPDRVADAERRYAERYGRTPAPNPSRVVIEIALTRAMGRG